MSTTLKSPRGAKLKTLSHVRVQMAKTVREFKAHRITESECKCTLAGLDKLRRVIVAESEEATRWEKIQDRVQAWLDEHGLRVVRADEVPALPPPARALPPAEEIIHEPTPASAAVESSSADASQAAQDGPGDAQDPEDGC